MLNWVYVHRERTLIYNWNKKTNDLNINLIYPESIHQILYL